MSSRREPRARSSVADSTGPALRVEGSGAEPVVVRPPRTNKRGWFLKVAAGLFGAGILAWVGLREWDPPALRKAAADFNRGDVEGAYREAADHLESRPWSRAAALIAAQSLARLNRTGEAEVFYRKAGRLDSDLLHRRAFDLIRANLNEQAGEVYREILRRSPDDVLALRRLAGAQILMSRWEEALESAGRLKRIPRGEVIGYTLAGIVYHDTSRADAAVVEFERVVALDPDLVQMPLRPKFQFWVYLIKDLIDLGRGGDARPHIARALADRQDPFLHDMLGQSFWQEGQFDEAERAWSKSIDLNPRRAQPWVLLGNLELQRNRPGPAVQRLTRAAELAPSAREPYYGLSMAYSRLGRREEAAKYRTLADRAKPEITIKPRGMGSPRSQ